MKRPTTDPVRPSRRGSAGSSLGWRLALAVVLAVLGLADVIVLNVVVIPRWVGRSAPEARPVASLSEADAGQAEPVGVDAGPRNTDARPPRLGTQEPTPVTHRSPDSGTIALPDLESLRFETNSSGLLGRTQAELDRVVEIMKKAQGQRVLLRGHADDRGNDVMNQRLSERRAEAAALYLVSEGVPADRVETEGVGEREPLDRSGTKLARARNRRIEVIWR